MEASHLPLSFILFHFKVSALCQLSLAVSQGPRAPHLTGTPATCPKGHLPGGGLSRSHCGVGGRVAFLLKGEEGTDWPCVVVPYGKSQWAVPCVPDLGAPCVLLWKLTGPHELLDCPECECPRGLCMRLAFPVLCKQASGQLCPLSGLSGKPGGWGKPDTPAPDPGTQPQQEVVCRWAGLWLCSPGAGHQACGWPLEPCTPISTGGWRGLAVAAPPD